ncbi:MAG TPA: SRPBCC domain-containing protein [Longimicrobiaceae bacterium]|nr:SRPBCC domain-containing protein [Longimicrobiaceae bacterium]
MTTALDSTGASATSASTADREIVLTRVFDAPRELVFRVFTSPGHMPHWWGPRGFRITTHEIDVRPGGVWRFTMHGPDGTDYPNWMAFREVVEPERLVYDHGGDGEEPHFHVTVTFEEEDGKTRLTMRSLFPSAEARAAVERFGAVELGYQTLDRLGEHLAQLGDETFVVTRTFDAPRDLVFRTWTERDHLLRWWGPRGFTMLSCSNDPRPGGTMHYGMRGPDGGEMWGKWVYREVMAPDRLVFVVSFSDPEGSTVRAPFSQEWPLEVLTLLTFDEHDGRTTVTLHSAPVNATDAERQMFLGMHGSMQDGWGGTLDKLAEHLAGAGAA